MSLQHVMRAEKLADADQPDEPRLKSVLDGPDLSEVRSDAGCNMLQVFLLRRWGKAFAAAARLRDTEDFQDRVVDAYLAKGCAPDAAVPSKKFAEHGGPSVAYGEISFSGALSALGIVQALRDQITEDMHPELHAQLERLEARLGGSAAGDAPRPTPPAPSEAYAVVMRGVRLTLPLGAPELADHREVAAALGMRVVVCADEASARAGGDVDVLVGVEVAEVSSEDGRPTAVSRWPSLDAAQERYLAALGEPGLHLGAFGPLATAYLVRGEIAAEGPKGEHFVGATVDQTPHAEGARGALVASAHLGARRFETEGDEALLLIARYD